MSVLRVGETVENETKAKAVCKGELDKNETRQSVSLGSITDCTRGGNNDETSLMRRIACNNFRRIGSFIVALVKVNR